MMRFGDKYGTKIEPGDFLIVTAAGSLYPVVCTRLTRSAVHYKGTARHVYGYKIAARTTHDVLKISKEALHRMCPKEDFDLLIKHSNSLIKIP